MKQIFFLHSAGPQGAHEGSSDFVSWLKTELADEYELLHPLMPSPDNPDYEPWKLRLDTEFSNLKGDVVLIGHSLGGSVLLKYLSTNPVQFDVQGLYLCAAPFWGRDGEWQYEPFTLSPDFADSLPPIPNIHIYHSKKDPFVPYRHAELYRDELSNSTLHEIEGDSHTFDEGIERLPGDIRNIKGRTPERV